MAPPVIDIGRMRGAVEQLVQRNIPHDRILDWLHAQGYNIGKRTFERRIQAWGICSRHAISSATAEPAAIEGFVKELSLSFHLQDTQIASYIRSQYGFNTTPRQIKRIRLKNGWKKNWRTREEQEASWSQTYLACWTAILDGPARNYGRAMMAAYLESQYNLQVRLDHVQHALHMINAELNISRDPSMKEKRRHEAIFEGPDYCWSIDGHDKFTHFGIEIYGMIDCHSRKIQSIYVGNTARTQISVVYQYLNAVKERDRCPKMVRSDRGNEVAMAADAHYALYCQSLNRSERELEAQPPLLSDCYLFGRSAQNQRIEALWKQLIQRCTQPWLDVLHHIEREGFFDGSITDQIIIQFVFIPLLRQEIYVFAETHNQHTIRRDKRRPNHISGQPNAIFEKSAGLEDDSMLRDGFQPSSSMLQSLQDMLSNFDPDRYITPAAQAWCEASLKVVGKDDPIVPTDFIQQVPHRDIRIPYWYQALCMLARSVASQNEQLQLVEKPTEGYRWVHRQLVENQLRDHGQHS